MVWFSEAILALKAFLLPALKSGKSPPMTCPTSISVQMLDHFPKSQLGETQTQQIDRHDLRGNSHKQAVTAALGPTGLTLFANQKVC